MPKSQSKMLKNPIKNDTKVRQICNKSHDQYKSILSSSALLLNDLCAFIMQVLSQSNAQGSSKEYLVLQHAYISFINREEPVSIHRIPTPFVANHLFGIKTVAQQLSPNAHEVLDKLRQKNEAIVRQQAQQEVTLQEDFEIGEKEENNEVVKLSLKGMKSLANMGSLFSSFIKKR